MPRTPARRSLFRPADSGATSSGIRTNFGDNRFLCTAALSGAFSLQKQTAHMKRVNKPHNHPKRPQASAQAVPATARSRPPGQDAVTGIPTGFEDLDRLTGGLHGEEVFVLAGRSGMGKTALAMNIASYVAIHCKQPVGVFSLGMSAEELLRRMLCSLAKVNCGCSPDTLLSGRDFHRLTENAGKLMRAPLVIDDTAGLTIEQISARARRMKRKHNIRLLVLDSLEQVASPASDSTRKRRAQIAEIMRGLKALAKESEIAVLALTRLEREQLGKLSLKAQRISKTALIAKEADAVGLLVRQELYADTDKEREAAKGKATLVIAKHPSGSTGSIELKYSSEYGQFEERKPCPPIGNRTR